MHNISNFLNSHHEEFRDNKAVEALLALASDARYDMRAFQAHLENWYNDAMDRVSGWYKRYTQNVLLIIGMVLAIAFNVDSVRITRTLWVDRDMRQALVAAATNYTASAPPPTQASTGSPETLTQLQGRISDAVSTFQKVGRDSLMPVGWQQPWNQYWQRVRNQSAPTTALQLLRRLLGWGLTAVALSFGAPFWFDTLNKIMIVRSTIKPEEKSIPEKSKDK